MYCIIYVTCPVTLSHVESCGELMPVSGNSRVQNDRRQPGALIQARNMSMLLVSKFLALFAVDCFALGDVGQ